MKVRKIDIEETLLDLPAGNPIYREAEYDPEVFLKVRNQGDTTPDTVTVRENTYEIRQLRKRDRIGGDYSEENYAVKIDSRGLFENLVQIGEDIFSERLNKAREDGFWDGEHKGFQKGEKRMLEAFRNLSWWKRLTGKF